MAASTASVLLRSGWPQVVGRSDGLADGGTKDLEDEHDGSEPGEDDEPSQGWTTSGILGGLNDREQDDCDGEEDDPAEASELSGIGDHNGLLEQVRSLGWTRAVMA